MLAVEQLIVMHMETVTQYTTQNTMILFKVISTIILLNVLILLYLVNVHAEFDEDTEKVYRETISLSIILIGVLLWFTWF